MCITLQALFEVSMKKDYYVQGRVNQSHYDKLAKILKNKGMTVSQWLRHIIESTRIK